MTKDNRLKLDKSTDTLYSRVQTKCRCEETLMQLNFQYRTFNDFK